MDRNAIIVVTGAAGFIGSCMVQYLNEKGFEKLILVDEFDDEEKELNLHGKKYIVRVERENFFEWLNTEKPDIKFIFHLGARTDTAEFDYAVHLHLNVEYSQSIWRYCVENKIPLVYASSAATYGGGEFGYDDNHEVIEKLQPLNPYGISKNEFDKWVLKQLEYDDPEVTMQPPFWAGLKFFNVYGPNEYHKARMASMVFHGFHQVKKSGKVKLFRSNDPKFADGEQLRDFVYVKDLIKMCYWFFESSSQSTVHSPQSLLSGIYNIGTGKARSFNDLAKAVFSALQLEPQIEYIDMPSDISDKYQNFTEAKMQKIRDAGYSESFTSLEDGVADYVANYLSPNKYY